MVMNNKKEIYKYLGVPILLILTVYLKLYKIPSFNLVLYCVLICFGYVASLSDLKSKIVSNKLIKYMLIAYIFLISLYVMKNINKGILQLQYSFFGFLFAGVVFMTVYIISKKGIGGADVKFMSVAGLYIGIQMIGNAMLYGSILGGIVGGIMILLKKINKKDTIPLIPFLYVGILIEIFIN